MTHEGEGLRQWIGRWLGIRGIGIAASAKLGGESLGLGVNQLQMHRGVILTCILVDVDIQAVVALHLQRGLHTCL